MGREMGRTSRTASRALSVVGVVLTLWAAVALGQEGSMDHAHAASGGNDTAYAGMQARGAHVMGVDQYTSTHQFVDLPDGGRIELQRDPHDTAGVAMIRQHLHHIALAFKAGDFANPMLVHMQNVPGTGVMAAKRAAISYTPIDLPGGGAVRITTRDSTAIAAVHQFLAFQRREHRTG